MIKETSPLILHNLLKHEKAKYETFHMDLQDAIEDKRINNIIKIIIIWEIVHDYDIKYKADIKQ